MYSLQTEYAEHVHISGDHTNAILILYYLHSSLFKDRSGTTKPAA